MSELQAKVNQLKRDAQELKWRFVELMQRLDAIEWQLSHARDFIAGVLK